MPGNIFKEKAYEGFMEKKWGPAQLGKVTKFDQSNGLIEGEFITVPGDFSGVPYVVPFWVGTAEAGSGLVAIPEAGGIVEISAYGDGTQYARPFGMTYNFLRKVYERRGGLAGLEEMEAGELKLMSSAGGEIRTTKDGGAEILAADGSKTSVNPSESATASSPRRMFWKGGAAEMYLGNVMRMLPGGYEPEEPVLPNPLFMSPQEFRIRVINGVLPQQGPVVAGALIDGYIQDLKMGDIYNDSGVESADTLMDYTVKTPASPPFLGAELFHLRLKQNPYTRLAELDIDIASGAPMLGKIKLNGFEVNLCNGSLGVARLNDLVMSMFDVTTNNPLWDAYYSAVAAGLDSLIGGGAITTAYNLAKAAGMTGKISSASSKVKAG